MFYKSLNWYASHFKQKKFYASIAEVDPTLFIHQESPKRVQSILGSDVLIIVTIRNPVERSISHYYHARRYGWTTASLKEAIHEVPEILEASRYSKYVPQWVSVFGKEQVILISYETLANNPEKFTKQLCRIIGLPYIQAPSRLMQERINKVQAARFWFLSLAVNLTAKFIRSCRLYTFANFAKFVGLKKLLYRPLDENEKLDDACKRILHNELRKELIAIDELQEEFNPFYKNGS